jgi:hypothetical protein
MAPNGEPWDSSLIIGNFKAQFQEELRPETVSQTVKSRENIATKLL